MSAYLCASSHHSPATDNRVLALAVDKPFAPALGHHLNALCRVGSCWCRCSPHESSHHDIEANTSKKSKNYRGSAEQFFCLRQIHFGRQAIHSLGLHRITGVVGRLCVLGQGWRDLFEGNSGGIAVGDEPRCAHRITQGDATHEHRKHDIICRRVRSISDTGRWGWLNCKMIQLKRTFC